MNASATKRDRLQISPAKRRADHHARDFPDRTAGETVNGRHQRDAIE
jgi:hypothetical protein